MKMLYILLIQVLFNYMNNAPKLLYVSLDVDNSLVNLNSSQIVRLNFQLSVNLVQKSLSSLDKALLIV